MGKAIIDISCGLMSELLHLPAGASVVYSLQAEWPDTIRLVIETPAIPETKPESALPHVCPVFGRVEVPSTVTMLDWGLPKA